MVIAASTRRNATIRVAFMKISERTLRITAASVLALIMVSAAYLLSGPNFLTSRSANAESTEQLLQAYASKDTDGDGLPDWEEALYGTDPNKAISNSFGIPDGQAAREGKLTPNALASQLPSADQGTSTPPLTDADFGGTPAPAAGSITEQFSREFFQEYVQASNGQPMDQATQQQLVTSLLGQFTQKAAASFASPYSNVNVHTSNIATLQTYSAGVEKAFIDNDIAGTNGDPLDLMAALIQSNDPAAKKKLLAIATAYQAIADDLKALSVPPSLSSNHVALVQSFETLSKATNTVAHYQDDPLGTMGAFSAFKTGTASMSQAITALATSVLANGEPQQTAPGYLIVQIARLTASGS